MKNFENLKGLNFARVVTHKPDGNPSGINSNKIAKMKINPVLALSLVAFTFAAPAVMAEENQKDANHEAHADHMLEGYAALSTALYKDDLATAQKTAAGMVKHDKDSAMAKHAQAIADSKTIEDARMHFKELSDIAIPIAKKEGTMHVAHCPMAMDGKGADWLQQSDKEIQNPYFGAKMAHCGNFTK